MLGLLDPKWIEQRDKQVADKRDQEEVYAHGSSIGSNLKQLAERRTDIFGSGAEEAQIGKKVRCRVFLHTVRVDVGPSRTGIPGHHGFRKTGSHLNQLLHFCDPPNFTA